jgi:STE24 endopeptidase
MKKFALIYSIFLVLYTMLAWCYLYLFTDPSIPAEYIGSSVDPLTFMDAQRYELSLQYRRLMNLIYLMSIPFYWGVYLSILFFHLAALYRTWTRKLSHISWIQTLLFVLFLSITTFLAGFPLSYIRYLILQKYGISVQTLSSWFYDKAIQFSVDWIFTVVIVMAIYYLMKFNYKRWWIYAWLLSIPFIIFTTYIQPVVIDPLYNDFYPLQNKELEQQILNLADRADIPADRVFEVNMSEKTNALNAYVDGIGGSLRIVLWDTMLNKMEDDEILFVTAHEIGHYVMNHLYWSVVGAIALSLVGLFVIHHIWMWSISRWGYLWKIKDVRDISSFPVLLLIVSLLTFATHPVANVISRNAELAADRYAMEMTGDSEAAVRSFQKMSNIGLSDVHPPLLIKILRSSHPTMLERIQFVEQYDQ